MGITAIGMATVATLIGSDTAAGSTAFDYVAIGDGDEAGGVSNFAIADVALQHELQREASTGTVVTTTQTNDTFQLVYDAFSFGSSYQITEVGVFNSASGAEMLSRGTFAAVAVTSSDTLKVTVKEQIVQGS